jgi:hypothetical protein
LSRNNIAKEFGDSDDEEEEFNSNNNINNNKKKKSYFLRDNNKTNQISTQDNKEMKESDLNSNYSFVNYLEGHHSVVNSIIQSPINVLFYLYFI